MGICECSVFEVANGIAIDHEEAFVEVHVYVVIGFVREAERAVAAILPEIVLDGATIVFIQECIVLEIHIRRRRISLADLVIFS
mgnify:CR=1 FL=1